MRYSQQLDFFRRILSNSQINTYIIREGEKDIPKIDLGIREFLGLNDDYRRLFSFPWQKTAPNTVTVVTGSFLCSYIFILLPEAKKKSVLIAGPYITGEFTREMLMETAEKYSIPPRIFSQLEKYYGNIPVFENDRFILTLVNSLGEVIWNGPENFSVKYVSDTAPEKETVDALIALKSSGEDSTLAINLIEDRYNMERTLIQAVSQGQTVKAEKIFSFTSDFIFEKRTEDPLRNFKNYLIVTNTLLRKAAEQGYVHPFYIDSVSSDYAKRIENLGNLRECSDMMREMIRGYCTLVKKHSSKNYSLLVSKTMTLIDSDITADLTLRKMAAVLSVNPSYLSNLFKKETGLTLTEYVMKKRMERAEFLLRTTSLQIQNVAQHCGIFDVNYFSKAFKKHTGFSPMKYRENK